MTSHRRTITLTTFASTNDVHHDLFTLLIRIPSYISKLFPNFRTKVKSDRKIGPNAYSDVQSTEFDLARITQQLECSNEIRGFESNLPLSNKLMSLTLFWNNGNKLIRVDVTTIVQHPKILPQRAKFTLALFEMKHHRMLHTGPRDLL